MVKYFIDGVDMAERYGVHVASSKGIIGTPKFKLPSAISWDNYHGEDVYLKGKYYQPREISLRCFIKASSPGEFVAKGTTFCQLFMRREPLRLSIVVQGVDKPLIFIVYAKEAIDIDKRWNEHLMTGTFDLKLTEPHPLKKVFKYTRRRGENQPCKMTITTHKFIDIHWGDGSYQQDVAGRDITLQHTYAKEGDYYPVLTGCVDEIEKITTNSETIWNIL